MNRIKVDGVQKEVPQFNEFDKEDASTYGGPKFHFEAAMVSTCAPLFDDCESNYEVEKKLLEAKVITPKNECDSESCALVVYFSSLVSANKFIGRLNAYLVEKARRLEAARAF